MAPFFIPQEERMETLKMVLVNILSFFGGMWIVGVIFAFWLKKDAETLIGAELRKIEIEAEREKAEREAEEELEIRIEENKIKTVGELVSELDERRRRRHEARNN
jgi:hypothetical protein